MDPAATPPPPAAAEATGTALHDLSGADNFWPAFEHAAIGLALVSPTGSFLRVNAALCDMLDRDVPTLMKSTWQELTHPDDLAGDEALVAQLREGVKDWYRLRKRYLRPNGEVVWGDLSVSTVRDPSGAVAYFVSQILDVTAQVVEEQRFRLLAENSSDIVALVAADGSLVWISPSVSTALGWPVEDLVGSAPWDLIHPDDRDAAIVALADAFASTWDQPAIEIRLRSATGSSVWVSALGHRASETELVVGFRVIEDEVRAREAVTASEARYRLLAENSSDVVTHSAPDGTVLWMSPSVETLLGWRPESLIGRPIFDVIHPDDLPAIYAAQPQIRAGQPMNFEARVRTGAGDYHWVAAHVRPILDDAGTLVGRVVGWRDIAAEHAARVALQDAERQYRLLAENASDVVFAAGPDRLVTWVSPSVTRVLGWEPHELIGTVMADLVHPDDREDTDAIRNALYSGVDVENQRGGYVVRMQHRDGSYHWLSSSFTILRHEDDQSVGLVGSLALVDDLVEARLRAEQDEALLQASADAQLDPQVLLEAVRDESGRVVDFAYVDVNRATVEYLGMTRKSLLGTGVLESLPGLAEAGLFDVYLRVLATHESATLDGFRYANELLGVIAFYDISVVFVLGDRISLTWRDVTERVEAARRVEQSEESLRATMDSMIDPHVVLTAVRDENGTIVDFVFTDANTAAAEFNGVSRADLIGVPLLGKHPAAGTTTLFRDYVHVVETDEPLIRDDWEYPQDMLGGEVRRYDVRAVKLGDGLSQTWRDVTERSRAAQLVAESEERFRLLAENSSDVILHAQDGIMRWLSPSLTAALGWSPEEWVGHAFEEFTHPDDVDLARARRAEINAGASAVTTLRMRDAKGIYHWVEVHAGPYDRGGQTSGIVASFRVVDAEIASQAALAAAEEHYRLLAENTADIVILVKGDLVDWISPSVEAAFDSPPDEWIGQATPQFVHPDDRTLLNETLKAVMSGDQQIVRARIRSARGVEHWVEAHASPYVDTDGAITGLIATFRVIDDLLRAEAELDHRARYDSLTGLLNRSEILQRVSRMSRQTARTGTQTAVLFCDVDRFKEINDEFGHAAGDEVLRTIGERVAATVRAGDFAARVGGDELLIVLDGVHSLEEATEVAEKIRRGAADRIALEKGVGITPHLSIGVTLLRAGESPDSLIERADNAMYLAKKAGRNRVIAID